jgi:hypothetical protein
MGREPAYTGKYVAWDEILNSQLRLTPPDIAAWDGSDPPGPQARHAAGVAGLGGFV